MSTLGELENCSGSLGSAPALNVLLMYEDAETGLRATLSLAAVHRQASMEAGFRVKLWRCDMLRTPRLREQAARDAAAADVIIVSLHGLESLTAEFSVWLNQWLGRRRAQECALGVLLDESAAPQAETQPVVAYFKAVARAAGVELLWGGNDGLLNKASAAEQVAPTNRLSSRANRSATGVFTGRCVGSKSNT